MQLQHRPSGHHRAKQYHLKMVQEPRQRGHLRPGRRGKRLIVRHYGRHDERDNLGVRTNSTIYCLNSTGEVEWSHSIGDGWYQTASPLIYDNKVIVASANGKVYAFDAKTGADAWLLPFDMESGRVYGAPSPIAYGGMVYVASGTGTLFALTGSGVQAWNSSVASAIYSSSPAAKNGMIYIGAEDGKLRAFDSMTGAQQWNVSIGDKVRGTPVLTSSGIAVTYVNYTVSSPTSGGVAFVSYAGQVTSYAQTGVTPASPALTGAGIVSATYSMMSMTSAAGETLWNVSLGGSGGSRQELRSPSME